jgi:hypothetical protein
LHNDVQGDPNAPQLRGTMAAYYEWLLKQSPPQRGTLASGDPAARLEKVKALRQEELRRDANRAEPADLAVIASWLEEQIYNRMPADRKAQIDKLHAKERSGALMLWSMTRPPFPPSRPEITSEVLASLRERLSPEGNAKLDALKDDGERKRIFGGQWDSWVSQAMRDSVRRFFEGMVSDVSEQDVVAFFEKLPEKQKDDLLKQPSDVRDNRLRIMYAIENREDLPEHVRNLKPETTLWWLRSGRGDGRWPSRDRGGFRGEGSQSPFMPPSGQGPRRPGPG